MTPQEIRDLQRTHDGGLVEVRFKTRNPRIILGYLGRLTEDASQLLTIYRDLDKAQRPTDPIEIQTQEIAGVTPYIAKHSI